VLRFRPRITKVELRDLEAYGEPGAIVYRVDCVELMRLMPAGSVGVIFADPPYRLSGGGVTVRSGRLAPVDKGEWDRPMGFKRTESQLMSTSTLPVSSVVPSG
jgi:site-specific DNA-methyltransferase (adenine-specific)